jgi:hypothetical protein
MDDSTVCPESTIESANISNQVRKSVLKKSNENGSKLDCRSTIGSANRRNFIRKAALASVAAGIGSTILARDLIPSSSASSNTGRLTGCCSKACGIGVHGIAKGSGGIGVVGCATCSAATGVAGSGPREGVFGVSPKGNGVSGCGAVYGVSGFSTGGTGVRGSSCYGIGISAQTRNTLIGKFSNSCICCVCYQCFDKSTLLQVQTGGCTPLQWNFGVAGNHNALCIPDGTFYLQQLSSDVSSGAKVAINKCGLVGIGNVSPSSTLCVAGDITARSSAACGIAMYGYTNGSGVSSGVYGYSASKSGVGVWGDSPGIGVKASAFNREAIPLVVEGAFCQTSPLQEWQNSCGSSLSVVNGSGWLGLGRICAPTTLAVKGSLSVNIVSPSGAYAMLNTDYAVLASGNVTLPPANTAAGMLVFIKSISATAITVSAAGKDKIEGKSSESLAKKYDSLTLISDGNSPGAWYIQSNAK